MTQGNSYLAFTKNRPARIAFLVDVKKNKAIDKVILIIQDAQKKWGGRYFQFIAVSHGQINKQWLSYLASYDPDLIYTLDDVTDLTRKKINIQTNPIAFCDERRYRGVPNHPFDPVDVLPDPINTANIWNNPFQNPEIIQIKFTPGRVHIPKDISNFLHANIGVLSEEFATLQAMREADVHAVTLNSNTKTQFLKAMQVIGQWNRRIYPIEYSMLPGVQIEQPRNPDDNSFTLYVGDDVMDLIHYWNDFVKSPAWMSKRTHSAWVPRRFMEDDALLGALKDWIEKIAHQAHQNSDIRNIYLRSSSVRLPSLNHYKSALSTGKSFIVTPQKFSLPEPLSQPSRIGVTEDMESFSVSGDSFTINIPLPSLRQGVMGGQKWMTDLFIERSMYNPFRHPQKELCFQLPKNNNFSMSIFERSRAARINNHRVITLPISRDKDERRLTVNMISMAEIVNIHLLGERNSILYTGDLRTGLAERPFENAKKSEAGKSLNGALGLFDGLPTASYYFQSAFWRRVFMALAGGDPINSPAIQTALENKVGKLLPKVKQPPTSQNIASVVDMVRKSAVNIRGERDTQSYRYFLDLLEKYLDDQNETDSEERSRSELHMRSSLTEMIRRNIFSIGMRARCSHCGLKVWYSVDEMHTHNNCRGCGLEFSIEAEEEWFYKLNSLIAHNGGIYNQMPVIMALGTLYSAAKSSFMFYPPVDVYSSYNSASPLTDLDVIAIVDGLFVIGEVKNDASAFTEEEINKLIKAALRIRPDRIVLFSPDQPVPPAVATRIQNANIRLARDGLMIEWLKPDPIDEHFATISI